MNLPILKIDLLPAEACCFWFAAGSRMALLVWLEGGLNGRPAGGVLRFIADGGKSGNRFI